MAASRRLPVVGATAHVRRLGHTEAATIIAVEGTEVTVATFDGEELTFALHRGKGHFYLRGDQGSTGPRLILPTATDRGPDG